MENTIIHFKGYRLPKASTNVRHVDWYGNVKRDTVMNAWFGERIGDLIIVDRSFIAKITDIKGSTRQQSHKIIEFERMTARDLKGLSFMVQYRDSLGLDIIKDLTGTKAVSTMRRIDKTKGSTFYEIIRQDDNAKKGDRLFFHEIGIID